MDADKERQRVKRHHSKVRTGCKTCKLRRVKCDEQRPVCTPCVRVDRECEYIVPQTWIFEPHSKQKVSTSKAAKPKPKAALTPPHLAITKETLDFRFFLENSLPLLCSVAATPETVEFNPSISLFADEQGKPFFGLSTNAFTRFWRQLIPQLAYSNPAVWKIVCLYGSKQRALAYDAVRDAPATNIKTYNSILTMLTGIPDSNNADDKQTTSPALPPETLMCASMCLFAYERLKAVTEPNGRNVSMLHLRATQHFINVFPENAFVKEYMIPIRDHFYALVVYFQAGCMSLPPPSVSIGDDNPLYDNNDAIPILPIGTGFSSCREARDFFFDICRSICYYPCGCGSWGTSCLAYQTTRKLIDQWLQLMSDYYNCMREGSTSNKQQHEEAKSAFTMLAEAYLVEVALTLSLRQDAQVDEEDVLSPPTSSSNSGTTTSSPHVGRGGYATDKGGLID